MVEHKQAILQRQRGQFGQHMALRVEQKSQRALAWREIADIPGSHRVEITDAVGAGEREHRAKIGVDQRDVIARRSIFNQRIAELRRQTHAEIFAELGAHCALRFEQRSLQVRGFVRLWFAHKSSLAEEPLRGFAAWML